MEWTKENIVKTTFPQNREVYWLLGFTALLGSGASEAGLGRVTFCYSVSLSKIPNRILFS
jgi:hypothetical protein